ncbi:hypothetical protein [Acidovorax sp. Root217]|uniref:hypothetical protein n=1 Tax=Acidovorax sp. Root217 TaxID=1736492 RepID=UPI0007162170|nr:hypothetical protein [Acidovorax sp. Root217]KRC30692.1 hypothetical protein ASE31_00470 [Acidovorax sp. Root217]
MWTLKDSTGAVVLSGTLPCSFVPELRGWVTDNRLLGDPHRALTYDDWPAEIAVVVAQIDKDVDAIYGLAIGNRQAEYEEAERQATAYAEAGYTGPVPPMVQCWADPKGWTAEQAADEILQQAGVWRGAQQAIRAQRLALKEQARAAQSPAALAAVRAAWAGFVAVVRAQLGVGAG